MSKVYTFLANGFEEVEALAVVDILRRAKVEVDTVSIMDTKEVVGAHKIPVIADKAFDEVSLDDADLLFLPGGGAGTRNLGAHEALGKALVAQVNANKRVSAICAAPSVLGELGLLEGKNATCYPEQKWEEKLLGANIVKDGVVTDGLVTTARGMGYAVDLGLELVTLLVDKETSDKIKDGIQYNWQ